MIKKGEGRATGSAVATHLRAGSTTNIMSGLAPTPAATLGSTRASDTLNRDRDAAPADPASDTWRAWPRPGDAQPPLPELVRDGATWAPAPVLRRRPEPRVVVWAPDDMSRAPVDVDPLLALVATVTVSALPLTWCTRTTLWPYTTVRRRCCVNDVSVEATTPARPRRQRAERRTKAHCDERLRRGAAA